MKRYGRTVLCSRPDVAQNCLHDVEFICTAFAHRVCGGINEVFFGMLDEGTPGDTCCCPPQLMCCISLHHIYCIPTCDAKAYDGPVSGSFDAAARRGARRGQRDEDGPTILVVLAKRCDVQSHKSSKTDSNSRSCVLLSRLCTCELVSVRNQGISVCLYAQTPLASCLSSPSHDLMLSLPTTLRLETTK